MKIISFVMSLAVILTSFITPASEIKARNSGSTSKASFFSIQAQEVMSGIVDNIVNEAKTGTSDSQDVLDILNNLPVYAEGDEIPHHAEVKVSSARRAMNKMLNNIVQSTMSDGMIKSFLNEVTSGMYDLYIYFVPVEGEENIYYINLDYINDNGEATAAFTGIKYNKEIGKVYGKDNNGIMGIGFDYDVKNYTVTTPVNVWMRDMGYSVLYDTIGGLGFMDTDTVRVKFEHDGKHWMFQFWKGNYGFGLLNGAELGIYNKTDKNAFSYNCATDEEMLVMSTKLRTVDEILIEREEMEHWWMCGFRFGPGVGSENLTMESTVQFEDEEMMSAFLESVKEYSDQMAVTADGMKVSIIWQ